MKRTTAPLFSCNCDKKFAEMSKMVQNDLVEGKSGNSSHSLAIKKRDARVIRRVQTLAKPVAAGFFRHLNNL